MDKTESSPEYEDAGSSSPSHEPAKPTIDLTPIRGLLDRIEQQYHPVQVWLFGSRARGTARPGSDWDILVVVPDDTDDEMLDLDTSWRLRESSGVRADVIPYRVSEFQESQDVVNTLAYEVAHTGRLIDVH